MLNLGHIADITVILSYLADIILTFIIAIVGCTSREIFNFKKNNIRISIFRIILGSTITSVLMVAVSQFTTFNFAIYSLLTFLFGLFSFNILDIILNVKYSAIVAKNIMKELGNPLLKGVSNAIDEVKKEKKAEEDEEKKAAEKPKEENSNEEKDVAKEYTKEELLEQIRKLEQERDSTKAASNNQ